MKELRLGVIGLSDGNGHPFSWSAILNGYNPHSMLHCGFPGIPEYLSRQQFPRDAIVGASVTHVWTQNESLSRNISEASQIPNVVSNYQDLVHCVDAVLLARDDAENHLTFAAPFLKAGIPIFVDKPLALCEKAAERLLDAQQYDGQLFSCSALRYSETLNLSSDQIEELGRFQCIIATVPKDWAKYSVHGIEAITRLIPGDLMIKKVSRWSCEDRVTVHFQLSNDIELEIRAMGSAKSPVSLEVFGSKSFRRLEFNDTFYSFKYTLCEFLDGVRSRKVKISRNDMVQTVKFIEAGLR